MKKRTVIQLVTFAISMSVALPSMAGAILDWSASDAMSTATGDIDLALGAGTVQGLVRNYTPGSAIMSTSLDSTYTENSIYGVVQVENGGTSATTIDTAAGSRMDESTPGLWLGVDGNSPAADEAIRSIAALVWYDLDTAAPATDHISAMSLGANSNGGIAAVTVRFAVQSGGAWYVSSDNLTAQGSLTYSGANWAELSAVADASSTSLMSAEGLTYDVLGTTLDNITAVGFFEEGTTISTTARARVKLDSLTAEVIPEPATLGLIAFFGGAVLFIRRRLVI
ncbi:hypothetical protein P4B35_11375 [Pontiellaceae bacterium B12227]|nr:hypothetical protein [Pontiellaceae bacterium B12227]